MKADLLRLNGDGLAFASPVSSKGTTTSVQNRAEREIRSTTVSRDIPVTSPPLRFPSAIYKQAQCGDRGCAGPGRFRPAAVPRYGPRPGRTPRSSA